MTFLHPSILGLAVLVVPGLALFFWWSWKTRQRLIARFVPRRLQETLALGLSPARARTRASLLLLAVAALLLSLARPQGGRTTIEVDRKSVCRERV